MKTTLGYFGIEDGKYLGQSCPSDCGNYYLVMGEIRKKICEHPDANPYRRHDVRGYHKTYCDDNRMTVTFDEYRNNNKHRKVTFNHWWHYNDDVEKARMEKEQAKFTKIMQFIIDNIMPPIFAKYKIPNNRRVYLPGYLDLNWGILAET